MREVASVNHAVVIYISSRATDSRYRAYAHLPFYCDLFVLLYHIPSQKKSKKRFSLLAPLFCSLFYQSEVVKQRSTEKFILTDE